MNTSPAFSLVELSLLTKISLSGAATYTYLSDTASASPKLSLDAAELFDNVSLCIKVSLYFLNICTLPVSCTSLENVVPLLSKVVSLRAVEELSNLNLSNVVLRVVNPLDE